MDDPERLIHTLAEKVRFTEPTCDQKIWMKMDYQRRKN